MASVLVGVLVGNDLDGELENTQTQRFFTDDTQPPEDYDTLSKEWLKHQVEKEVQRQKDKLADKQRKERIRKNAEMRQ